MRKPGSRAYSGARLMGALLLVAVLLAFAAREERFAVPWASLPETPGPPLVRTPGEDPLDRLVRRYADKEITLEVIYANPLLPVDEAVDPVFRVVAVYPPDASGGVLFPGDPGVHALFRNSDGRVVENLVWQEEDRRPDRVLGYLSCRPDGLSPLLTPDTRWVELSLIGVTQTPLRFRWSLVP